MSLTRGARLLTPPAGSYGGPGQQPGYGGPQAQSPAGYGGQPMGYSGGPPSAGGYGRGQQSNPQQWNQPPQGQNFNNGFSGYQG